MNTQLYYYLLEEAGCEYELVLVDRALPQPPARLPRIRACVAAVAARAATRRACASEGVDVYDPGLDTAVT
jgi:hypothetical protein